MFNKHQSINRSPKFENITKYEEYKAKEDEERRLKAKSDMAKSVEYRRTKWI
jgi:hypothetical protein